MFATENDLTKLRKVEHSIFEGQQIHIHNIWTQGPLFSVLCWLRYSIPQANISEDGVLIKFIAVKKTYPSKLMNPFHTVISSATYLHNPAKSGQLPAYNSLRPSRFIQSKESRL